MSEGARWYVIHTYSGYENKVKANIEKSVENLTGANLGKGKKRLLTVDQPLRIVLGKEGKIKISVDVTLPKDSKVKEACLALQKEIATNLSMMIEAVPTEIHVHVAGLS